IPEDEMKKLIEKEVNTRDLFIRCLHNPTLFEVNGIDDDTIRKSATNLSIQQPIIDELIALQKKYLMSEQEVRDYMLSLDSNSKDLFDKWDNSPINRMTLTSVGIAIGHANTRRITKESDDLSIWIN
ncbi:MAG: hypothetical protein Q8M94_04300, partial [Ignavibacteria bacterium]|nr:hypothetical protein [Ignavibacteria bacterium]